MAGKGAPISILGKDLIEVCGISNTRKYESNVIPLSRTMVQLIAVHLEKGRQLRRMDLAIRLQLSLSEQM